MVFALLWYFWAVPGSQAQPLHTLAELGILAQKLFYAIHQKEFKEFTKGRRIEDLIEICNQLPERVTYELREYLGKGGVRVGLFSFNYVDVANNPPASIMEALLSIKEQYQIEYRYQPRILIKDEGRGLVYAYVVPLLNKESCLLCHGKDAPYASLLKKLYPEKRSAREREGDLRGVLVIYISPKVFEKSDALNAGL